MKTKTLLVIITLMITFLSCKKGSMDTVPKQISASTIEKIKNWYRHHEEINAGNTNKENEIPVGYPDWDKTHYYSYEAKTICIIPMRFDSVNSYANQFFLVELNNDKEVINLEYAYLLLNKNVPQGYTNHDLESLAPETFSYNSIPEGLDAWIMKFDTDKKFISSKYLKDGAASNANINFKDREINRAPTYECQNWLCIEWFWQVWVNGVLVYEEYLYTSCGCNDSGNGGGSGSSQCNYTQAYAQAVLDNMTETDPNELSAEYGSVTYYDGTIRQPKNSRYKFLTIHLALNPYAPPQYTAKFSGIRYKYFLFPFNDPWKWEGFDYHQTVMTDGIIPTCTGISVQATVSRIITGDGLKAIIALDFTANITITCAGINSGSQVGAPLNGTRNKDIYAGT